MRTTDGAADNAKVVGIIAEYDPIHNGHVYHLGQTRMISRADFVLVAMSGDWTQRGGPAILDKWTRARLAVEAGADLVVELPAVFALSSGEGFARGGVRLLRSLGCDTISFGSECGDMAKLRRVAACLKEEPPAFRAVLRDKLDEGMSFPKAR